jgi:hypothetical protein
MYRNAVAAVFLSALAVMAADLFLIRLPRRRPRLAAGRPRAPWLRVLVNMVGLASFAAMAATGFSALLTERRTLTGGWLLWHVGCAPAFALAALATALFWAHRNRFAPADRRQLRSAALWAIPLRKLFFWAAAALAVPTMLSILAAMLPFAGPDDQQELFLIHRCCAPLLAACALLFAYFALVAWREGGAD